VCNHGHRSKLQCGVHIDPAKAPKLGDGKEWFESPLLHATNGPLSRIPVTVAPAQSHVTCDLIHDACVGCRALSLLCLLLVCRTIDE
jgi:hypothetical protein